MITFRVLAIVTAGLSIACGGRHPLFTRAPAQQERDNRRYLKIHREAIFSEIAQRGALSALIVWTDPTTAPTILPGQHPLAAARGNEELLANPQARCQFVYSDAVGLRPAATDCLALADQARREANAGRTIEEIQEGVRALQSDALTLRERADGQGQTIAGLSEAVKGVQQSATKLAAIIAPAVRLTEFQASQIKQLEGGFDTLHKAFAGNTAAVTANNEQIQTLTAQFNAAMASIQKTMTEIKTKADTLK